MKNNDDELYELHHDRALSEMDVSGMKNDGNQEIYFLEESEVTPEKRDLSKNNNKFQGNG